MSQIAVRVDDELKKEATAIFNELGLDMSTAVKLFLIQSVLTKSIPFEVSLREREYSREEIEDAKKEIKRLVKQKSDVVKLDFSKQEDIDLFFGDEEFPEYEGLEWDK
ncbi:putative DNA-damage-inducible protein J [Streptococcus oralis]|uniref:Putative DNA-damage-inducible protein J n=1 Tax=Streptococcus oralis TaxID=1303 RepID=A0A139P5N8_STROR|nr:type II toxin-antitoxin system RelB/DinJ family antitoxin [Streptococcus oralis]KXT83452.1 putative DNA-damage-inducible protein J [Streptococcus oralis]